MGMHKPFDRHFFTVEGLTMPSGGSLDLAKGQFGVFYYDRSTNRGLRAVESYLGLSKDTRFQMRLGISDLPVTRSQSNKSWSTFPFKLSNISDLKVSVPERQNQSVDEVVIGWNGIDDYTNMVFEQGNTYKFNLELSGETVGLLGYDHKTVVIPAYVEADRCSPYKGSTEECDPCDPCAPVDCLSHIQDVIDQWRTHELRGGWKIDDLVTITPVKECTDNNQPTLIDYDFYCVDVCDTGDQRAQALVEAQYPGVKVIQKSRKGAITSYEMMLPRSEGAPAALATTIANVYVGCDCPQGYTETPEGWMYTVTLEDDGSDATAIVEGLANAVGGTANKWGQQAGVGLYTVLLTEELSDANFNAFVLTNPTATIYKNGKVDSLCSNKVVEREIWTLCGSCTATTESYCITLPDNECGEDRLEELQAAYPDLNVAIATVGEGEEVRAACQTRYCASTVSNIVCEECDPVFLDFYTTEAPANYDGVEWVKNMTGVTPPTDCKCGIRFKGKEIITCPDECLRDELGFMYTSTKVRITGGYLTERREGVGQTIENPFHVTQLSKWEPLTHLGGQLWQFEDASRKFFSGEPRHMHYLERIFRQEESHIEACSQYVDYSIRLERDTFTQGFANREDEYIVLHIYAPLGKHQDVENILNSLAGAAGIPPVQAFG